MRVSYEGVPPSLPFLSSSLAFVWAPRYLFVCSPHAHTHTHLHRHTQYVFSVLFFCVGKPRPLWFLRGLRGQVLSGLRGMCRGVPPLVTIFRLKLAALGSKREKKTVPITQEMMILSSRWFFFFSRTSTPLLSADTRLLRAYAHFSALIYFFFSLSQTEQHKTACTCVLKWGSMLRCPTSSAFCAAGNGAVVYKQKRGPGTQVHRGLLFFLSSPIFFPCCPTDPEVAEDIRHMTENLPELKHGVLSVNINAPGSCSSS